MIAAAKRTAISALGPSMFPSSRSAMVPSGRSKGSGPTTLTTRGLVTQTAQGRGDVSTVTELVGRLLGIAESRTERMHARAGDEEIGITKSRIAPNTPQTVVQMQNPAKAIKFDGTASGPRSRRLKPSSMSWSHSILNRG